MRGPEVGGLSLDVTRRLWGPKIVVNSLDEDGHVVESLRAHRNHPVSLAVRADLASRPSAGRAVYWSTDRGDHPEGVSYDPKPRFGQWLGEKAYALAWNMPLIGMGGRVRREADAAARREAETPTPETPPAAEAPTGEMPVVVPAPAGPTAEERHNAELDTIIDEIAPPRAQSLEHGPAVTATHPNAVSRRAKAKTSDLRTVRIVGVRVKASDNEVVRGLAARTNEAVQRAREFREAALAAEEATTSARGLVENLPANDHPSAPGHRAAAEEIARAAEARNPLARLAFDHAREIATSLRQMTLDARAEHHAGLSSREPDVVSGVLDKIAHDCHRSRATEAQMRSARSSGRLAPHPGGRYGSHRVSEARMLAQRVLETYPENLKRSDEIRAQREVLAEIAAVDPGSTRAERTAAAARIGALASAALAPTPAVHP
ncbi:MAG: hypothetical protein DLM65_00885, partial [Candidatus Aeolococcus gillhamiae]